MAGKAASSFAAAATAMHSVSSTVRIAYRVLSPSLPATPVVMIQGLTGVKEVRAM